MIINSLIVFLIVVLIGTFPAWPHSRHWGYVPSGGIGVIVLILILLILFDVV